MKKSLLALAALTAFAGVASAQSSVTLFGIIDLAATSLKTGSNTVKSLSSNGTQTSRLGFRGVEDLGGGLRAGFWLEAQVGADTGALGGSNGFDTVTFNRRATVSLLGGFGELRLGRDYTPTFWNYTTFDPFGTNGVASSTQLFDSTTNPLNSRAITQTRTNNTIGYFLPALGGLYGQVQAAAGENQTGQKYVGGRFGYAAGPVNVAVATGKTYKTGPMIADYKETNVGGSFNAGFANFMGWYAKHTYGAAEQKTYNVGVVVPVGAGLIKASFGKSTGTATALAAPSLGVKQFGLGYEYGLSKRTALFANYGKNDNDRGSNFDRTGYQFGVRHSF